MIKVMLRVYPDNEVVALFPCESGDPTGKAAVAFAGAGGFYSVDASTVVGNTRAAQGNEGARLKKQLTDEPHSLELEIIQDLPEDAAEQRLADPDKFKMYGRVARLHANR